MSQMRTALVVDDDPLISMMMTEAFEDVGYTCVEAQDGSSALTILQSDIQLDLLVTDLGLPGNLSGRDLAAAGRALRPSLKVLFVTGYLDRAEVDQLELTEGMRVLLKPFMVEGLQARASELMGA